MHHQPPRRIHPGDRQIPATLDLIQRNFAYMDGRIDPPSSMLQLSEATIEDQCTKGEVWVIGEEPVACIFLTIRSEVLYIGKVTTDQSCRGQGFARILIDLAAERARSLGLGLLELNTRIELTDNHRAFGRLGFRTVRKAAHPGYQKPTYLIMQRSL